tara:strand:- start:1161 stop:1553 length:393 start_codon:yes stop_codon:yes gene_type:complete
MIFEYEVLLLLVNSLYSILSIFLKTFILIFRLAELQKFAIKYAFINVINDFKPKVNNIINEVIKYTFNLSKFSIDIEVNPKLILVFPLTIISIKGINIPIPTISKKRVINEDISIIIISFLEIPEFLIIK